MSIKADIGAASEYRFASACLARGLIPSWPSTDSTAYDMVVDTGKQLYRVQVKGTEKSSYTIDYQFTMKANGGTRRYNKRDVDFIVLFVFKQNVWYIFPISDAGAGKRLRPDDPWCKYIKFKNAWNLIDKSLSKG